MSWKECFQAKQAELITVGDWLSSVEELLEQESVYLGHGTDNYWDEGLQLVFAAMGLPLTTGREILTQPVHPQEQQKILQFLQKRIDEKQPLPYITGQAWFMQMPFSVDERVLIPRSPIGEWIERRFQPWVKPEAVRHICDIGTGSGCIAIGLALMFPQAQVDAVDICPQALVVAQDNIQAYELNSRVRCVQGDALFAVADQQYDLIVSNPPYVPAAEEELLPDEYRHEPRKALYSGESGLDIVDGILANAYHHLCDGGILVLEVGQTAITLAQRYPQLPFVWLDCENGGEGVLLLEKHQLPH